jgi:hypothetical protein
VSRESRRAAMGTEALRRRVSFQEEVNAMIRAARATEASSKKKPRGWEVASWSSRIWLSWRKVC